MSDDTRDVTSDRPSPETDLAASHQERLEDKPFLLEQEEGEDQDPKAAQPGIDTLRALVADTEHRGTAFQSVAVAAVQILERALCYEREAADAALSLGQQEKLESMVDTIEQAAAVLRSALSAQGAKVMHLCNEGDVQTPAESQPWWFALTDALEVLEEGTSRMTSLTAAQPGGSPARKLSQSIAQLLRGHHDELLLEADDWIS